MALTQLKTLFFGTPEFAVPFVEYLHRNTDLAGVITREDKPSGRKQTLTAPPIKIFAVRNGIRIFQPAKLKEPEFLNMVRELQPDLGVVTAYGRIIPRELFEIPRLGCLNIHFSLLPKYRGAAPVQWALLKGEIVTGVTSFWIDEGMDTGPVFLQQKINISPDDNTNTLLGKLAPPGICLLEQSLKLIEQGHMEKHQQSGEPSLAPMLKPGMSHIDWNLSALEIHNMVRALAAWPEAYAIYETVNGQQKQLKVLKTTPANTCAGSDGYCLVSPKPGEITGIAKGEGFFIKCNVGFLKILEVQPEGKSPLSAWSFWQGARLKQGDVLR